MDRTQFENLRDLNGKRIVSDIRFTQKQGHPQHKCEVEILDVEEDTALATLYITYNENNDSKNICVAVKSVGPICRLDIDHTEHGDEGRTHKHSLQNSSCSNKNLPEASSKPDLSGKTVTEAINEICSMANITLSGSINSPDEGGGE